MAILKNPGPTKDWSGLVWSGLCDRYILSISANNICSIHTFSFSYATAGRHCNHRTTQHNLDRDVARISDSAVSTGSSGRIAIKQILRQLAQLLDLGFTIEIVFQTSRPWSFMLIPAWNFWCQVILILIYQKAL